MDIDLSMPLLLTNGNPWMILKDGDPIALHIFKRHYSFYHYKDNRRLFNKRILGPGEKLLLVTPDYLALFGWRKFISKDNQAGINCAIFRNEGPLLSSELIIEAEYLAWQKWPGERLYTYVNPREIKSVNPGYCFKMAGWKSLETPTKKRGFIILEKLP